MAVIVDEALNHLFRRDKITVVVVDCLGVADVGDTPNGRAADAPHTLGERIDRSEQLVSVLVEEQVVVAKMRSGKVPMEVF
jgi:hypothetical protein